MSAQHSSADGLQLLLLIYLYSNEGSISHLVMNNLKFLSQGIHNIAIRSNESNSEEELSCQ